MAERPSKGAEIPVRTLGGLNERPSPANLRPGEFDVLEGLYPASIGLLARIPGKTLLSTVTGRILQIHDTQNVNGDILISTDAPAVYVLTLDELLSRATTPSLTPTPITEEENMSMAIMVQREANNAASGSIDGFVSGSAAAAADTWYPRRLTNRLSDPDGIITTFTAAGSGAGAASFGSFELAPGTYRISAQLSFYPSAAVSAHSYAIGLWNATSGTFEVYSGGSDPIVGIVSNVLPTTAATGSILVTMEGEFTVATTNKTYHIRQKCADVTAARVLTACGFAQSLTGTGANTGVNGAAVPFTFAFVKILKVA